MCSLHPPDAEHKGFGHSPTSILNLIFRNRIQKLQVGTSLHCLLQWCWFWKLTASELYRCPNLSYNEDVLRERSIAWAERLCSQTSEKWKLLLLPPSVSMCQRAKAQLRYGDPEAKSYFGLSRSTTRTVTWKSWHPHSKTGRRYPYCNGTYQYVLETDRTDIEGSGLFFRCQCDLRLNRSFLSFICWIVLGGDFSYVITQWHPMGR